MGIQTFEKFVYLIQFKVRTAEQQILSIIYFVMLKMSKTKKEKVTSVVEIMIQVIERGLRR